MHDDSYTKEKYTAGLIEGMYFHCVKSIFAFYNEHSRLTSFGVVKKSAKKEVGQLKYVTFGYDKCQKTTARNQSKRVEYKGRENYRVMNDGLCVVKKVILEHNHELELVLSHFLPCHMELGRTVKKSLVGHDIADFVRKSLLEVSKWVPIFLKYFFSAGMLSTQRCESMHAFFDGYISGQSSLKQFVEQYEVFLRFKYEKELESQASERKQLVDVPSH
ncbi:hypothetical protein FXO38_34288 [Capsicum annuum]|nr:hypothetical protein FXO38_34288 [Capsicum annuum]